MLGRLARMLRLLGYDAVYRRRAEDHELARLARAEGRVLVTRDCQLAGRRGLRSLFIRAEAVDEQIRQVLSELPLQPAQRRPRCSVCNGVLSPASGAEVAHSVPPYVLRTQAEFHICQGCGRVYWQGSQARAIREFLDRLQTDADNG
jgi:uncharacterized protein with PIN domain